MPPRLDRTSRTPDFSFVRHEGVSEFALLDHIISGVKNLSEFQPDLIERSIQKSLEKMRCTDARIEQRMLNVIASIPGRTIWRVEHEKTRQTLYLFLEEQEGQTIVVYVIHSSDQRYAM